MKKIKYINLFIIGILTAGLTSSCYPDKIEEIEDLDLVQTQYDASFSFGDRNYYLLPDTIPLITDNPSYVKSENELALEQAIIDEIEFQMNSAGYTRLAEEDTTDSEKMEKALIVLPTRGTVTYTEYYYDYYYYGSNYWDFYYGFNYYYPGYSWNNFYPWGYPSSYSYSIGTVIIEMIDPSQPFRVDDSNEEVSYTVRWLAILNGLAESSLENTENRIKDGIEQAFNQSPYLYE